MSTVKLTYGYRPVPVDLPNDSCHAALGGVNYLLQSLGHNAWNDYLWTAVSCSSDPVMVGTTFTIVKASGERWSGWSPVVSIEKPPEYNVSTGSEFFGFGFGVVVFFYLLGLKGSVILRHFWRH